MTERAIFRYEVPVDDEWHRIEMTGDIVHVAARAVTPVEIWAFSGDYPAVTRELRVFGTGQSIPPGWHDSSPLRYVGTALVPGTGLVWHVLQRMATAGRP